MTCDQRAEALYSKCPLRIAENEYAGCCEWGTFLLGFSDFWWRFFDQPPTAMQWQTAKRDWKSGNTGYEAAHNAHNRHSKRAAAGELRSSECREIAAATLARIGRLSRKRGEPSA